MDNPGAGKQLKLFLQRTACSLYSWQYHKRYPMALLVNGERIENADLEKERRALRRVLAKQLPNESAASLEERAREWAGENLIERVLLNQAARRDPEPISAEAISQAMGSPDSVDPPPEIELRLRAERLINRVTSRAARPRRKDLVDYYRKHRETFLAEEAVHAAHIVKYVDESHSEDSALSAITQIHVELLAGKSFEQLADEFSDSPGRGGDLGFFPRGHMVVEFDSVAFALAPGEISDAFRTQFGFHIVKVYGRRAAGVLPFDAVSSQIEELLFSKKKQKLLEQHLDSMRAKAEVREVD